MTAIPLRMEPSARPKQRTRPLIVIAEHSIAIALGVIFLAPIVFLALTSFMTSNQTLTTDLWPHTWHPENYADAFTRTPLARYLLNTLIYATCATAFMLLASIPAAYALSKLRWRGRSLTFVAIICVMMLPPQVVTVPLYLLWANWGLTGWRTLLRVVIPMIRPGIAAAGMFQFFYAWNDYYGPLLYPSENEDAWTLSLGLASFRSRHNVEWHLISAATLMTMLPIVLLFFVAQKAFVQGVTLTGVKK